MRCIVFTEFGEAGSPGCAAKPNDATFNFSSPPARFAKAARNNASAIGLRQVFPVQTNVTVSRSTGMDERVSRRWGGSTCNQTAPSRRSWR